MRATFALAGVLLLALGATRTSAVILIGNLPGNDGGSTFMNAPSGGSNGGGVFDSKAAGFTMPAGAPYILDYVDLRLDVFNTSSVPSVSIYSNAGGNPGVPLTTLNSPPPVIGISTFRFTPASAFELSPSTTYWAVVVNNATVANSFRWMANSPSIAPTGLATNAGYRFSNGAPPPTGNSTTLNSYEVGGSIVPEPAIGSLIAAVGIALLRRR